MSRWDILFIAFALMAGAGLWLIHPAAALIIIGTGGCVMCYKCAPVKKRDRAEG